MRPRAITDLAKLRDEQMFAELEEGLHLIAGNALAIQRSVCTLAEARDWRGARILKQFAQEEAAKALILMDAVRCPRQPQCHLPPHLRKFNDHLAKALYSQALELRPATFGEICDFLDRERDEFFLDGPNDVDFIMRNSVLQQREAAIYVDYVDYDDHHAWATPKVMDSFSPQVGFLGPPTALELVRSMQEMGAFERQSLELIATRWRPLEIATDTHWQVVHAQNVATLEDLNQAGILQMPQPDCATFVERWGFPLWSVDLRMRRIDRDDLARIQNNWSPDW